MNDRKRLYKYACSCGACITKNDSMCNECKVITYRLLYNKDMTITNKSNKDIVLKAYKLKLEYTDGRDEYYTMPYEGDIND